MTDLLLGFLGFPQLPYSSHCLARSQNPIRCDLPS
jgi:hypothetical protein